MNFEKIEKKENELRTRIGEFQKELDAIVEMKDKESLKQIKKMVSKYHLSLKDVPGVIESMSQRKAGNES